MRHPSRMSPLRPRKRWSVRKHATKHLRRRLQSPKWSARPFPVPEPERSIAPRSRNRFGTIAPRKSRRHDAGFPSDGKQKRMPSPVHLVSFPPHPPNLPIRRTPETIPGGRPSNPASGAPGGGRSKFFRSPKRRPSAGLNYPLASRVRGEEGTAVLIAQVANGRVLSVTVETSSGFDRLNCGRTSRCCDGPSPRRNRFGSESPSRSGSPM